MPGLDGNGCDAPSSEAAKDMLVMADLADIEAGVSDCLQDLNEAAGLCEHDLLVIGASSSEVVGRRIGSATSLDIGRAIVRAAIRFAESTGCSLAFQCCEHLNRALVVTRETAVTHRLQKVTAIPVPGAGGAVAAVAFATINDACLVSSVSANAGIDIGDTLIGMHCNLWRCRCGVDTR